MLPIVKVDTKLNKEATQRGNSILLGYKYFMLSSDAKLHVLYHELGHWFRNKYIRLTDIIGWRKGEGFYGLFATLNVEEGFAESFAVYFTNAYELRQRYPTIYTKIKSFVRNKESAINKWAKKIHKEQHMISSSIKTEYASLAAEKATNRCIDYTTDESSLQHTVFQFPNHRNRLAFNRVCQENNITIDGEQDINVMVDSVVDGVNADTVIDEAITQGMRNAYARNGHKKICDDCGSTVPKYSGRYPSKCPECGGDLHEVTVDEAKAAKDPYFRALDRIANLEKRGVDMVKHTMTRLKRTSNEEKIAGIYRAAKDYGMRSVMKAAKAKYKSITGEGL